MRLLKILTLTVLPCFLVGCMTSGIQYKGRVVPMETLMKEMRIELREFEGKSADTLISKLGLPGDEKEVAGRKVLVWELDRNVVVDDRFIIPGKCKVLVEVDAAYIMKSFTLDGNNGGCSIYLEKLDD